MLIDIPVHDLAAAWSREAALVVPDVAALWDPLRELLPVEFGVDGSISWHGSKVLDDLGQPRHVWSIRVLREQVPQHSSTSSIVMIRGSQ